jgi:ubiquinone/menaquinone biosynthesis C-methylase UbiE
MARKRIDYPGPAIDNGDAEKHFKFYDTKMRRHYLRAARAVLDGIGTEGKVLDIGCGAGVLGVMLCDKTEYVSVAGLEKSGILIRVGEATVSRFGYGQRISFKTWDGASLPFDDDKFDAVVSMLSLNRWGDSARIFKEIERVRKNKSVVLISDFRRECTIPPFFAFALKSRFSDGKEIAADLFNSHRASYTTGEIKSMLSECGLHDWSVEKNGLLVSVSSPLTKPIPMEILEK